MDNKLCYTLSTFDEKEEVIKGSTGKMLPTGNNIPNTISFNFTINGDINLEQSEEEIRMDIMEKLIKQYKSFKFIAEQDKFLSETMNSIHINKHKDD